MRLDWLAYHGLTLDGKLNIVFLFPKIAPVVGNNSHELLTVPGRLPMKGLL